MPNQRKPFSDDWFWFGVLALCSLFCGILFAAFILTAFGSCH